MFLIRDAIIVTFVVGAGILIELRIEKKIQDLEQLRKQISETEPGDRINNTNALQNDNYKRLIQDFNTMKRDLKQIKECQSRGGIAFTVMLNEHKPTIGKTQIIDFDQVLTNIGNAFNPTTSIFTAPINGVYVFDLNIGANAGDEDLEIVKNGNHLQRVYGNSKGQWEVSSAAVSTHMVKGDAVGARQYTYNTGLVGHELTSFSGYLVHADCNFE